MFDLPTMAYTIVSELGCSLPKWSTFQVLHFRASSSWAWPQTLDEAEKAGHK
jgi:hypothetical protein